jgi:hypothetical protein
VTSEVGIVRSLQRKERNATVTTNGVEGAKPRELNHYQNMHISGEFNIYKPIEAYAEEWVHVADEDGNYISAHPKPGTRVRQDLPPLAEQWRRDAEMRSKRR